MIYEVHIRCVATGEVRVHEDHDPKNNYLYEDGGGFNPFQWDDGNYGCDCNRHLFFERAGGELEWNETDEHPCGDEAYRVVKIVRKGEAEVLYTETDGA
jgi:hypothetical protein